MSVPISGPRQVQAIAPWAFCLQGHQVGPSVGVVGSPLISSPRVPGGLEESRRDSSTFIRLSFVCAVQPRVAGSLVAMTKPVPRDAKLKVLGFGVENKKFRHYESQTQ